MQEHQKCMLCGRPAAAGLNVMGCLICFPCERALLTPLSALRLTAGQLRALRALYDA